MAYRTSLGAIVLVAAQWTWVASAQILDYSKYPDLKGQWVRYGPSGPELKGPLVRLGPTGQFRTRFDPHKPPGRAQEPPFTPEYQALFEANLKDQEGGGQGSARTFKNYMMSAEGLLMPTKKNQPPPDLRYFNQSRN